MFCLSFKWKQSQETQTLRAGCSKAEPKFFAPPQTPFQGARDGQNLTSWRWSLPSPTDPAWWGSMYAISSYHGNRPTHKPTQPQTGPITIHCTAASAQYKGFVFGSKLNHCVTVAFRLQLHGNRITEYQMGDLGFSGPQLNWHKSWLFQHQRPTSRLFRAWKIKTWISGPVETRLKQPASGSSTINTNVCS